MKKFILIFSLLLSNVSFAGCINQIVIDYPGAQPRSAVICDNSLQAVPIAPTYTQAQRIQPVEPQQFQPIRHRGVEAFNEGARQFNQGVNAYSNSLRR